MKAYTESVTRLIDQFARMPGVGRKTAERLAFYVLKIPKDEAMDLAFSIRDVKKNIRHCRQCFNLAEEELCPICADPARDAGLLCVVEFPRDLMAIEDLGEYRGRYHVLLGVISPVDDTGPDDIRVAELLARAKEGTVKEVIIFTNPTAEGDMTALYIAGLLKGVSVTVTRMARGVPAGSELEFVNKGVIADALKGRTPFEAEE
ncbi:recombination mediator RecR [Planctomycetota bacterium]